MKIRSITYFAQAEYPLNKTNIEVAGLFLNKARTACESAGFQVQTIRLALPPFGSVSGVNTSTVVEYAMDVEAAASLNGIDYTTVGPALLSDPLAYYEIISDVLEATQNVFAASEIAARFEDMLDNPRNLPIIAVESYVNV